MLGCVAIAALPPLNGFVSEWLMYLGLVKYALTASGASSLVALLAVGLLALIGGLAAITFVRLAGIALLGSPRSEAAMHAHESSRWMLGPMFVLVVGCLTMAMIPQVVLGPIRPRDRSAARRAHHCTLAERSFRGGAHWRARQR